MIVLKYKYKSVKNNIQHTQTHATPNAADVIELAWPNNMTKALSTVMMHKQIIKQKNNGDGGNPSKKNNPRKNRGGGNNNSDTGANVSVTNAAKPPELEGEDALEANQVELNAETVREDPTPTNNGGCTAVWFILSSVGDDDSLEDDIIWAQTKENNKTTGVVRVIRAETVENDVPCQHNSNLNGSENETTVLDVSEGEIKNLENVSYYNNAEYNNYQPSNSDTLLQRVVLKYVMSKRVSEYWSLD